ncbi:MAG: hypothetical protein HOK77_05900 [Flavobacteriales bacterium]|nr:hypothetical protein [Flavobacteriales bacterium]
MRQSPLISLTSQTEPDPEVAMLREAAQGMQSDAKAFVGLGLKTLDSSSCKVRDDGVFLAPWNCI